MAEEAENQTFYLKDSTSGEYVEAQLPSFADGLPEELRGHEAIKDMDAAALATAYVDLHSKQPRIPEEYEIPQVPEGLPADTEAIDGFKSLAKEIGLTQAQMDKIVQFDFSRAQKYVDADRQSAEEAAAEIKKNREAANTALNKEWGSAKEAKMELVAKVKNRFVSEDTIKKWDESGLSDDPEFLKFLAEIGDAMDEDRLILPDRHPREIPRTADGRPVLRYDHPTSRNKSS